MEGDRPKSLAEFKEIFNKCIDQYLTDTPTDCVISQEKAGRILKVLQNDPDFSDSEITSYVKQDKIQLQDFPLLQLKNVLCTVKKGRKTANRLNDDLFGRFRRVVLKEEFFDMIYKAHSQHGSRNHIGFEKTIFQLKRNYSHIPCEVVLKFMKMCPVCAGSVAEENISLFCLKYEDDIPADPKCQQNPGKYIKKEKPKKVKKSPTTMRKAARAKAKTTTTTTTTVKAKTKTKVTSAKKTKATAKKTETSTRKAKRTSTAMTTATTRETTLARQPKANTNIKISNKIFGERPSQQDHDYVRTRHHLPITYSLAGPKNSSVPNFRDYTKNQRVHVLRASYFMAVGRVTIIDIKELQAETVPSNQFTLVVHYVDLWSKYSVFWPLCKKDISELALGIAKNVFAYFGAPRQLIYNGCTMQAAEQLEEVLRVWSSQINVTTSILEDPLASSGPLHWRIFEDLKTLPQDSWESHLSKLQYLANTKFVKTHGRITPYEAVFGHMPLTETFVSQSDTQSKTPANGNMTNVRKKQRSSSGSKGSKASTAGDSVPANASSNTSNDANSGVVYEAQLGPLPSPPYPVACTINIANRSPRSLLPSTLTVLQQTTAPTPMSDSLTYVVSKTEPTSDSDTLLMEVDNNNTVMTTAATSPMMTACSSDSLSVAANTTVTDSATTSIGDIQVKMETVDDTSNELAEIKTSDAIHNQATISAIETVDAAISMIKMHQLEKDNSITDSTNKKKILKKPTLKLPPRSKNTNSAKILKCYRFKVKQNLKTYAHYKARSAQHKIINEALANLDLVEHVRGALPESSEPNPDPQQP
ncbi:uncharacterized protein LOC115222060 isoform X2 [Octopus sinensis]|uniref:Uncharacterized protein LOC115222060 isoform X2 n=1 Tax=Octopus sinensis TaxID=2607531 RepID=A0A7E6FIY5_9MOLL|nr:uncharacterized protein LOC115222060 isoform X2 [Octopus sinensis]